MKKIPLLTLLPWILCGTPLVDSLTLEEKVGQLLMTSLYPDQADDELDAYLHAYSPGHVLLVGNHWDPEREKKLIERAQSQSKHFLTVAQDLEWGLGQRLDNVVIFPKNADLVDSPDLVEKMGEEIARECHILGVNLNLAPVADVNNNPHNIVIGKRSFGDDPAKVARLAVALMKGLQKGGIKTCAKHFPGHGDTSTDSHHDLPVIHKSWCQLKQLELIPFKALIDEGVDLVMPGHICLPLIDDNSLSASLSPVIIKELLKKELNFKGLVITDDLLMGALSKRLSFAEAALKAYQAGNDILLFTHYEPGDTSRVRAALKEAHRALVQAVIDKVIDINELNQRVEAILLFKKSLHQRREAGVLVTPEALELAGSLGVGGKQL